ncbi:serpin-type proteinase inhibitor 1 [Vairimorpha necatrix]|uniref:Serpin-type proteinase inhibitor 1 n=1 Tax=Vairimorpha necatrix TaxID=6039 RepID=A0AAX4J9S7_9MICR
MQKFIQAIVNLSYRMFEELISIKDDLEKNQAISPIAFTQALGLLANSIQEDQRDSIIKKLGFGLGIGNFNENSMNYLKHLVFKTEDNNIIVVKNYLLYRNNYKIERKFKNFVKKYFDAFITSYDIKKKKDTIALINDKIAEDTNNSILNAMDSFSSDTCLLIMNIIYLKQEWCNEFDYTQKEKFIALNQKEVLLDMMHQDKAVEYNCFADETLIAIDMPFLSSDLSFIAIMPRKLSDFNKVAKNYCSSKKLDDLLNSMEPQLVALTFPKFKFEYEIYFNTFAESLKLEEDLGHLLINILTPQPNNYEAIGKQKVIIEVNELGMEVFVKTEFDIPDGRVEAPGPVLTLKFDQTFFWVIMKKDKDYGINTPIVMGKFNGLETD